MHYGRVLFVHYKFFYFKFGEKPLEYWERLNVFGGHRGIDVLLN